MQGHDYTAAIQVSSADSLLSMLPDIRRIRGWRLYAANGVRILSLWSDYGRNLLGYVPRGLTERAKSAVDRGLIAPSSGTWNRRIARMVRKIYPEYTFIRLMSASMHAPRIENSRFLFDSFIPGKKSAAPPAQAQIVLPIPAALSLGILAFTAEPQKDAIDELIDGLHGYCAVSALSLMASELKSAALSARFDSVWKRFDSAGFELFSRSGPWLLPRYPREAHRELFEFCAKRGVLISPEYDFPSSVPGDFDEGELACLQDAASVFL